MTTIEALSPVFSHDLKKVQGDWFCTHDQGQNNLARIGARLAGNKDALVGLYVVERPEAEYNTDAAQFGRVVCLVRMLPMPAGHTMSMYPSGCPMLKRGQIVDRWPFGWPCEPAFWSPHGGPVLRDAVAFSLGIHSYADFAMQFMHGPVDLRRLPALRNHLMKEVRNEVARNPQTQIKPF